MWFIKIHVVLLFYTKDLFNSKEKMYEVCYYVVITFQAL